MRLIAAIFVSTVAVAPATAEQSSFGDYQVPRIDAKPETHVSIVRSDALPVDLASLRTT